MNCIFCGNLLTGRQTKFCSRYCKDQQSLQDHRVTTPKDQSGPNNPNWKGGHKHWSQGRHGKDKDGLSWKTQRQAAWERDSYTCQGCGVKGPRNPDVHHISPWLNSLSHHLDNLICLCKSCHMKEDAKAHEQWGGQLVLDKPCKKVVTSKQPKKQKGPKEKRTNYLTSRDKPCRICGEVTRSPLDRGCPKCLISWVLEQRKFRTSRSIGEELGVSHTRILQWCKE